MKVLIVSDIHGSGLYARKLDQIIKQEQPDQIVVLGDLYYHGPRNSLTEEYAPLEVADILNSYQDKMLGIKGNCDAEVDEMITQFPLQDHMLMDISGLTYFFTHGHKYNIDHLPDQKIDVLVYGHFHTGFFQEKDGILCVNSGSIALPKGGTKNSYLIIEDKSIYLKDIEGNILQEKKM